MLTCLALIAHAADPAPPEPSPDPGTLHIDAKLPAEVLVDGAKIAQLWHPGALTVAVSAGPHTLRIYTHGDPEDFPVQIEPDAQTRVVVGRTGITLDSLAAAPADPATPVAVELRSVGGSAQVRLADRRIELDNGERVSVQLAPGDHRMSVRSRDGTVIWATGVLEVGVGEGLVVQVAEGRLPELSGAGRFHASGG